MYTIISTSGSAVMMRRFKVHDAPQRSPEWFKARAGLLTGSVAAHIFATLKSGGEAAARRDLRTKLVVERLTGRSQEDDYDNADMKRGRDLEPAARAAYEAKTGLLTEQTGFIEHLDLALGCSLDGHWGDFEGIIELKCPRSARHLSYLRNDGSLPAEHKYQVLHNLFVTGAKWCDFVSFDPSFPDHLQLWIVRVERDSVDMKAYELAARLFLDEVQKEYDLVAAMEAV